MRKIYITVLFLLTALSVFPFDYTLDGFLSAVNNKDVETMVDYMYDDYILFEKQRVHIAGNVLGSSPSIMNKDELYDFLSDNIDEISALDLFDTSLELHGYTDELGWVFVFTESGAGVQLTRIIYMDLVYEGGA